MIIIQALIIPYFLGKLEKINDKKMCPAYPFKLRIRLYIAGGRISPEFQARRLVSSRSLQPLAYCIDNTDLSSSLPFAVKSEHLHNDTLLVFFWLCKFSRETGLKTSEVFFCNSSFLLSFFNCVLPSNRGIQTNLHFNAKVSTDSFRVF